MGTGPCRDARDASWRPDRSPQRKPHIAGDVGSRLDLDRTLELELVQVWAELLEHYLDAQFDDAGGGGL